MECNDYNPVESITMAYFLPSSELLSLIYNFYFKDNPNLTQGGTISQPYPISQTGLMSQHAYGLSQQDFSQPVLNFIFIKNVFLIVLL